MIFSASIGCAFIHSSHRRTPSPLHLPFPAVMVRSNSPLSCEWLAQALCGLSRSPSECAGLMAAFTLVGQTSRTCQVIFSSLGTRVSLVPGVEVKFKKRKKSVSRADSGRALYGHHPSHGLAGSHRSPKAWSGFRSHSLYFGTQPIEIMPFRRANELCEHSAHFREPQKWHLVEALGYRRLQASKPQEQVDRNRQGDGVGEVQPGGSAS